MKFSRRYFTLIEFLLGLSLGLVLITLIFVIYLREVGWKQEFLQKEEFEQNLEYMHLRFNQLLSSVKEYKNLNKQNSDNVFCSAVDGNGLIFTYRNEADMNPQFCGKVLGQIFLDEQRLCLATWPLPSAPSKRGDVPCKLEVLFDGVSACSFSFYSPKEGKQSVWGPQQGHYPVFAHLSCDINGTLWTCSYEFTVTMHAYGDPILK